MGSQWFYSKNGQQFGPISAQELKQLADTGQLSPTDIVWKEGIKDGFVANKIAGLFSKTQPQTATTTTAASTPPPQSAKAKDSQVPPPLPAEPQSSSSPPLPPVQRAYGDTKVKNARKFFRKMPFGGWIIASILLLWLSLLTQFFPLIALMLCLLAVAVCYELLPTILRASHQIGSAKIPKEPTETAAQSNKPLSAGVGCLILAVGIVLFLIVISAYEEHQRSVPNSDRQRLEAWVMAQHFIKERLKSPSTASFGGVSDYQNYKDHVTSLGNQAYAVHGWVDAQNGFGGVMRADFSLEEEYVGNDKWSLKSEPTISQH